MTSTSNKALYVGATPTQIGFDVSSNAASGYTRVRGVTQLDWGSAPAEIFSRPRPLRDGDVRFGRRHGPRTINMQLGVRVSAAGMTVAQREAARDDEWAALQDILYPEQGLMTIKQTRLDYSGANISREIKGELQEYTAWQWQPDSLDDGFFGRHDHPLLLLPLQFLCPFPWFMDTAGTTDATTATLDGTLRTTSITNSGLVSCGLYVEITATSGTATVALTNGAAPTALAGLRLLSISPTSTPVILDWYYSDPLAWTLTQGSTDLSAKLDTGSGIGLLRGSNTLGRQVTSGSLVGGAATIKHRCLWGTP